MRPTKGNALYYKRWALRALTHFNKRVLPVNKTSTSRALQAQILRKNTNTEAWSYMLRRPYRATVQSALSDPTAPIYTGRTKPPGLDFSVSKSFHRCLYRSD